jgi:hypothetical protein
MRPLYETVTELGRGAEVLRRRRYGVIEAVEGRFDRVRLRPYPALVSAPYVSLDGDRMHRTAPGDRCRLYYNQPWAYPNFLALKYVVSTRDASLASFYRVLETLDEIARLKRADALLCDVANWRISERLLSRLGWETHCPSRWHRHYIKRFYGDYPARPGWLACCLSEA